MLWEIISNISRDPDLMNDYIELFFKDDEDYEEYEGYTGLGSFGE